MPHAARRLEFNVFDPSCPSVVLSAHSFAGEHLQMGQVGFFCCRSLLPFFLCFFRFFLLLFRSIPLLPLPFFLCPFVFSTLFSLPFSRFYPCIFSSFLYAIILYFLLACPLFVFSQLAETLRYKPEGHGFNSQWGPPNVSLT